VGVVLELEVVAIVVAGKAVAALKAKSMALAWSWGHPSYRSYAAVGSQRARSCPGLDYQKDAAAVATAFEVGMKEAAAAWTMMMTTDCST
jgi:hypothetical protein